MNTKGNTRHVYILYAQINTYCLLLALLWCYNRKASLDGRDATQVLPCWASPFSSFSRSHGWWAKKQLAWLPHFVPCHPKRYEGNVGVGYTTRFDFKANKERCNKSWWNFQTFFCSGYFTGTVLLCTSQNFSVAGAQLLFSFSRAGARPSDLHAAAKRGDLRQLQQRLAEGWAKD